MEHLGDPGGQEMGSTARDRTVEPSMVELKYPPHFSNAGSGDDETGSQSPLQSLSVILALLVFLRRVPQSLASPCCLPDRVCPSFL